MWYVLKFREVLAALQKIQKSFIFSNFAHRRTARFIAHMWLISKFCNETIHIESESTPNFMIFNTHKIFIDIFINVIKNFCFKFIFLDLSRSNNESNDKYLLQLQARRNRGAGGLQPPAPVPHPPTLYFC